MAARGRGVARQAIDLSCSRGGWPSQMLWGRALFLSKVEGVTTDPMDYRILVILPRLCWRWVGLRLRDLATRAQQWQLPEMYAGVPGAERSLPGGTSDCCAYRAHSSGDAMLAGALDIYTVL